MLLAVRKKQAGWAKEILLQCDSCKKEFIKNYKKFITEKKHHFCSQKCTNREKRKGGIICKKLEKDWLEKYNVINVFQLSEVKNKIKTHMFNRYGVENCSQSPEIKTKKTKTYIQNYGVDHPMKSDTVKEKIKQTCLKKYGVTNVSQHDPIFNKQQNNMKSAHKNGHIILDNNQKFFYRSSYEEKFLKLCNELIITGKIINILSNIKIPYCFDGKSKFYFADFKIITRSGEMILCEIKPKSLLNLPINISKFAAAHKYVEHNNISKFIIVTEDGLKNINSLLSVL